MKVRQAAFAGSWYPSDPHECQRQMEEYFEGTPSVLDGVVEPVGGIVPHAGWAYSGHIAGQVVSMLRAGPSPDTVIIFGGHLGPRSQHLIMAEGAWNTPFGPLEVDCEMAQQLLGVCQLRIEDPERAQPDNTLELQLPMIAFGFRGARILPLATAPTEDGVRIGLQCAQLASQMGRKVRVIGSTDLTHYGLGYGFSPKGTGPEAEEWVREVQDPRIIQRMEQMVPSSILDEALTHSNACCPGAAAAAVACMNELGARVAQIVAYATSRDVYPGDDFVGYVGIVYWS